MQNIISQYQQRLRESQRINKIYKITNEHEYFYPIILYMINGVLIIALAHWRYDVSNSVDRKFRRSR